jgi:cellulose synthase/poly-beta-1,6-N-acetylglucosamine synthase-like glycosyltransferase
MPTQTAHILTLVHFTALGGLALYGMHRLWLLYCWRCERRVSAAPSTEPSEPSGGHRYPFVTVQLPLYNERFVAARLLDAAASLQWPLERLEIQVLDDSDDDTCAIVAERALYWSQRGVRIEVVRREGREGFKAGALAFALQRAQGELVAVFDADFVPPADFLNRTVPLFGDVEVGMVQARWGFVNEEHSWFTAIQALLLGPHFSIEHWVRWRRGLFFNFNGTAGIWRRIAIESAGGWQSDTVTEDLDLSYRAQLAGWRFVYLDDLNVPSELPVTLSAFRCQQQRWAKGSVQTAKKILPRLLAAPLPLRVKAEALAHLLANFGWLLGAIVTLTLYPAACSRVGVGLYDLMRLDLPLFVGASGAILLYFYIHARRSEGRCSLLALPLLPVLSIGLAPSIALSVLRGTLSRGGVFQRTPKYGLKGRERLRGRAAVYRQPTFPYLALNSALLGYTLLPLGFAWQRGTWPALPFFFLFPLGFLLVIGKDLQELLQNLQSEG